MKITKSSLALTGLVVFSAISLLSCTPSKQSELIQQRFDQLQGQITSLDNKLREHEQLIRSQAVELQQVKQAAVRSAHESRAFTPKHSAPSASKFKAKTTSRKPTAKASAKKPTKAKSKPSKSKKKR